MKTYQFQFQSKKGWVHRPAKETLNHERCLILAFCSPLFRDDAQSLKNLQQEYPKALVVGCSTSGEIYRDHVADLSISCLALDFESSRIKHSVHTFDANGNSQEVGAKIAKDLLGPDLRGVILLSDGLVANGSELAQGMNSIFGKAGVPIAGGLAGDGNHFKNTWIMVNGEMKAQSAVGVGLYGQDLFISTSSRGGWDIFGPERVITKSTKNVVFEIDGRPALDLYKEYLGDKAQELPASGLLFPIQIRNDANDHRRLVRTILAVDEKDKSLVFAGNVPQNCLAQFMMANFDRVIDGAASASDQIRSRIERELGKESLQSTSACLAVSCVGRRLVLGARTDEEIEAIAQSLGPSASLIGFYSYGELAPTMQGAPCDLHNQSMTLMNIFEVQKESAKKAA